MKQRQRENLARMFNGVEGGEVVRIAAREIIEEVKEESARQLKAMAEKLAEAEEKAAKLEAE